MSQMDRTAAMPVLVYTDNLEVKSMAADPEWAARNAPAWLLDTSRNEDGSVFKPTHTDITQPENITGSPQSSVINAWADQFGLAGAAHVVVTRSGFSRWAIEVGLLEAEDVRSFWPDHDIEDQCHTSESIGWKAAW